MPLIKHLTLLTLFCLSLNIPSYAKDNLPADTRADLALLKAIFENPRLLSPRYLECYLGSKAGALTASRSQSLRSTAPVFKTFWLDREEIYPRYTLEQSAPAANKLMAEFSFALTRPEGLLIKDLSKTLDEDPVKGIDENGHPILSYTGKDPTVRVLAYQDTHIVNLTKVALQYSGPALLPPAKVDMDAAIQHRHDAAFENARLGRHDKATNLLRSHLKTNPNDAEAHLQLADSYKASSCINQAISEYKIALANCGNDKEIHDRCIAGLHALKVDLPHQSLPGANSATLHPQSFPQAQSLPRERININPAPIGSLQTNSPSQAAKAVEVGF